MKTVLALAAGVVLFVGCDRKTEAPQPYGKPATGEGKAVERAQVKDPVCGMMIDSEKAKDHTHKGVKYYFCSDKCHDAFEKAPDTYSTKSTR